VVETPRMGVVCGIAAASRLVALGARLRRLLCIGGVLALLTCAAGEALAAPIPSSLVKTIKTSRWSPASPDPSGIAYDSLADRLLVVDGEVDEMSIFKGVNYFETTLAGALLRTANTTGFSHEPVGLTFNPAGRVFVADDDQDRVFEITLGANGRLEAGDPRRSFSTLSYGSSDPEGVAYDSARNRLFIADGAGTEIYAIDAVDGVFGNADDRTRHFDTRTLGISDPETVEFSPARRTLYLIGVRGDRIVEVTTSGDRVSEIDTSHVPIERLGGLAYAPSSRNAARGSFYITDRKVDNDGNPNENDGTIYEVTTASLPPPQSGLSGAAGPASETLVPVPMEHLPGAPGATTRVFAEAERSRHDLRRALAMGIALRARCSTACTVRARVYLRRARSRKVKTVRSKPIMVATGSTRLSGAGTKRFRISFTSRATRRLRSKRRVTLSLHVAISAPGGVARTREVTALVLSRR
jgi:DNA-binding beta-propeller fold protein YncE